MALVQKFADHGVPVPLVPVLDAVMLARLFVT